MVVDNMYPYRCDICGDPVKYIADKEYEGKWQLVHFEQLAYPEANTTRTWGTCKGFTDKFATCARIDIANLYYDKDTDRLFDLSKEEMSIADYESAMRYASGVDTLDPNGAFAWSKWRRINEKEGEGSADDG